MTDATTNGRDPVAWAWPAVFGLFFLITVGGLASATVWWWVRLAG